MASNYPQIPSTSHAAATSYPGSSNNDHHNIENSNSNSHYQVVMDSETKAWYIILTREVFEFLNMQKIKVIGDGATGDILLMKSGVKYLAAKTFMTKNLDPKKKADTMKIFHQEISTRRALDHSNIVKMAIPMFGPSYGAILMEYYPKGALFNSLNYLTDSQVSRYFIQILSAVAYMHRKRIVHRDIKLDNILCRNNDVFLTDFGISQQLPPGNNNVSGNIGTDIFMAPEVKLSTLPKCVPYDGFKADAFAMGVLLWCLIMRNEPNINTECWNSLKREVESGDIDDDVLVECARQLLIGDVHDRTDVIVLMEGLEENNYLSELLES